MNKTYTIFREPIAWARAGRNKNVYYDTQKSAKLVFALDVKRQHGKDRMFVGPLHFEAVYYMPLSQTKMKMWDKLVGTYHTNTPDKDNLTKFVWDAIKGVLIKDDRIIASEYSKKVYCRPSDSRTVFTLTELEQK